MLRFVLILMMTFLLVACDKKAGNYNGYVDNKLRYLSSNYSGILTQLNVHDGDAIKKGETLFTLEPYPEQMNIDELKANIASTQAVIQEYETKVQVEKQKYARRQELQKEKFAHEEEVDEAKLSLDSAIADLTDAKSKLIANQAQLARAEWQISKKTVVSRINGHVNETYYYESELVPAERPILSVIDPRDTTIYFFVPENEISTFKLGQKVSVTCDGCKPFTAHVSYIAPTSEFTPPTIFSVETRAKMSFLLKARASDSITQELHPGQPVSVNKD